MAMHMGHLSLRVTDVEAYMAHIEASLGIRVLEHDESSACLACQPTRRELRLIQSESPGFDHLGLVLETEDELDVTVESAVAAGGEVIARATDEPGCGRSVTVVGPAGITHQLYTLAAAQPASLSGFLEGSIRRLGHLTFLSNETEAVVAFWRDGLGFRVSDTAAGFTWMRCDAYHHTLAVGPHPAGTVLHHHAWEIQDVSAMTRYCDRNAAARRPQSWGPVRHGPGFNIATYMPDQAGALIEVYTDLLMIEDDTNYEPIDWSDVPLALNLWGTMPSQETLAAGVPVLSATAKPGEPRLAST